ncbi:MAG TPA: thioredoxin family protein [Moraxellaceae bacterium]
MAARLFSLLTLWLLCATALAASSAELRTDHLHSRLVSSSNTAVPGQTLKLGLLLRHDAHWHSYWKNAGDSGSSTNMHFTLPGGVSAGAIEWPLPERLPIQNLVNYGYSDRVLLPVTLTIPAGFAAKKLDIVLKADWLVCQEECIPGEGEYRLSLPVAKAPAVDSAWAGDFARSARRQPQTAAGQAEYGMAGDKLTVRFSGSLPADISQWTFFPETPQLITNAATPQWEKTETGWQASLPVSEYFVKAAPVFPVLLVQGDQGLQFQAAYRDAAATAAASFSLLALLPALGLALLGGITLNLMPCVFPVLSFKALAVLEQADNRPALRRHGIFYTLGVVLSFLVLAGILLALRAAGEQIGWGFQLQEPRFVAALVLLLFVMALSFAGLLEIGAGLAGLGQSLTEGRGDRSAFFTGVLAAVVASPCTAPFMGTALGYALSQPAAAALAVFAALGLGLALPLLLLGFIPALAKILPRPGAWMEGFRQFLAFPLLLTVVWLLWVYGEQTSPLAMAWLLGALVLLAFGIWLLRRAQGRRVPQLIAGLALAAAIVLPLSQSAPVASVTTTTSSTESWSAEKLAALRAAKKPVLVNMTAAWCITCLANERSTLSTDAVKTALLRHGVSYLKGDWTRRDPAITQYLQSFGRNGVPLYVLYPAEGEPQVLPQLLTPALVQEALASAAAKP